MLEYEIDMPEEDIYELYNVAMNNVVRRYTEEDLLNLISYANRYADGEFLDLLSRDEGESQCS